MVTVKRLTTIFRENPALKSSHMLIEVISSGPKFNYCFDRVFSISCSHYLVRVVSIREYSCSTPFGKRSKIHIFFIARSVYVSLVTMVTVIKRSALIIVSLPGLKQFNVHLFNHPLINYL